MPQFTKAATKSDIPTGTGKTIEMGGEKIALFNVAGTFYAISNTCAHRGGPLGEGDLADKQVTCPWHGWQFDVTTGASLHNPATVKTYPVQTAGEDVLIEI